MLAKWRAILRLPSQAPAFMSATCCEPEPVVRNNGKCIGRAPMSETPSRRPRHTHSQTRSVSPIGTYSTALIADDHPVMLEGLCYMIQPEPDLEVVAE
jgi:hypothetical protein